MPLVIDIEGSGALQYLRPEIANPPAIHLSLSEVPQRIGSVERDDAAAHFGTYLYSGRHRVRGASRPALSAINRPDDKGVGWLR